VSLSRGCIFIINLLLSVVADLTLLVVSKILLLLIITDLWSFPSNVFLFIGLLLHQLLVVWSLRLCVLLGGSLVHAVVEWTHDIWGVHTLRTHCIVGHVGYLHAGTVLGVVLLGGRIAVTVKVL
jgi:hypothetical protein